MTLPPLLSPYLTQKLSKFLPHCSRYLFHTQNQLLELKKLLALQTLGKKICYHKISSTMLYLNISLVYGVFESKISYVYCSVAFAQTLSTLLLHQNCACVVLKK